MCPCLGPHLLAPGRPLLGCAALVTVGTAARPEDRSQRELGAGRPDEVGGCGERPWCLPLHGPRIPRTPDCCTGSAAKGYQGVDKGGESVEHLVPVVIFGAAPVVPGVEEDALREGALDDGVLGVTE